MRPSKEAIREFKSIWKEEFGEEISDNEAYESAVDLLGLFEIICRPIGKGKGRRQNSGPECRRKT